MADASFTLLHADHGITDEQLSFIEQWLKWFAPPHFFILQIEIPPELGTVPNAMVGPACGDDPVLDGPGVFLKARGEREWEDRMCFGNLRPCSYVQAIGTRGDEVNSSGVARGDITVFTVYGGPLAPQHPDDPTNADPEASRVFWAEHALATGTTLEQELASDINAHMHGDEKA